jgi:Ca2+-binding RTX toxin-like protein
MKKAKKPLKLQFDLSDGNDTLYIGVPGANITINAGGGNDSIGVYDAANATLHGGNGDDWLFDYSGHATLYGDAGNDVLYGTGHDTLVGGAGADRFLINYDWMHGNVPFDVILKEKDFNPTKGDILDLTQLGTWTEAGFTPVPQDHLFLYHGDLLIMHPGGGVDAVENVGAIALVGISAAIDYGWLQLDYGGGKG